MPGNRGCPRCARSLVLRPSVVDTPRRHMSRHLSRTQRTPPAAGKGSCGESSSRQRVGPLENRLSKPMPVVAGGSPDYESGAFRTRHLLVVLRGPRDDGWRSGAWRPQIRPVRATVRRALKRAAHCRVASACVAKCDLRPHARCLLVVGGDAVPRGTRIRRLVGPGGCETQL